MFDFLFRRTTYNDTVCPRIVKRRQSISHIFCAVEVIGDTPLSFLSNCPHCKLDVFFPVRQAIFAVSLILSLILSILDLFGSGHGRSHSFHCQSMKVVALLVASAVGMANAHSTRNWINYETCYADMAEADANGDNFLDKEEFLSFMTLYGANQKCMDLTKLPLTSNQEKAFDRMVCGCSWNMLLFFCTETKKSVSIEGVTDPNRALPTTKHLNYICHTVDNALGASACLPSGQTAMQNAVQGGEDQNSKKKSGCFFVLAAIAGMFVVVPILILSVRSIVVRCGTSAKSATPVIAAAPVKPSPSDTDSDTSGENVSMAETEEEQV